jgi:hypothetical protein
VLVWSLALQAGHVLILALQDPVALCGVPQERAYYAPGFDSGRHWHAAELRHESDVICKLAAISTDLPVAAVAAQAAVRAAVRLRTFKSPGLPGPFHDARVAFYRLALVERCQPGPVAESGHGQVSQND